MAADITVGDNDLHWGIDAAESNLRISGVSISSRVKHEEDVDDETGNVVGYGASGHVTTAKLSGMIRSTGPGWNLAAACTVANTAILARFGNPTPVTVVCTGLSGDAKTSGRQTGSWDMRLLDFS